MNIGDRVTVLRDSRVVLSGVLTIWEDDSDHYFVNVEGWAKVKADNGTEFLFRRDGGLGYGDWLAKGRSLRKLGYVSIQPEKLREEEGL